MNRKNETIEKLQSYSSLQNQWLKLKIKKIPLEKYFIENEINVIAIYGFGDIGKRFYEELRDSQINILYAVDQNAEYIKQDNLLILKKTDTLKIADALIVTVVYHYAQIKEELRHKIDFPIISLEEVIYGL